KPAALEASDDRNLSAASRQKQLGEAWIVEQPLDLLDHELTLRIGEFTGRSRKIAPSRLLTCCFGNVRQRLQQPMHQRASRQCLVTLDATPEGRGASRRRLVIGGREEANRRRLGCRVALEPCGRPLCRHRRGCRGKRSVRAKRHFAIAPYL